MWCILAWSVSLEDILEDAMGAGAAEGAVEAEGVLLAGVVSFIVLLFIGALFDGATFVSCGVSFGTGVDEL